MDSKTYQLSLSENYGHRQSQNNGNNDRTSVSQKTVGNVHCHMTAHSACKLSDLKLIRQSMWKLSQKNIKTNGGHQTTDNMCYDCLVTKQISATMQACNTSLWKLLCCWNLGSVHLVLWRLPPYDMPVGHFSFEVIRFVTGFRFLLPYSRLMSLKLALVADCVVRGEFRTLTELNAGENLATTLITYLRKRLFWRQVMITDVFVTVFNRLHL